MKKSFLLLMCLSAWGLSLSAQAPKWAEKAKRAVFSIMSFDKDNKILANGNGFFVGDEGIALSDYTTFKGADHAVIITSDGRKLKVTEILGANDMYDVVKFRVEADKKLNALSPAKEAPVKGSTVYLLPYSTQKDKTVTGGTLKDISTIGGSHHYYTLDLPLKDKMVSTPITNEAGQVIGIVQKSTSADSASVCYAVGVNYAMSLQILPLSANDLTLRSIGIAKALPAQENDALIYLLTAASIYSADEYQALLDQFVRQFPNSTDGYIRRANLILGRSTEASEMDKAVADMEQALKIAKNKDDVHYNLSKQIAGYQAVKGEGAYKDWTYDKAIAEIKAAQAINPMPIYVQFEGDIYTAMKNYAAAYDCYDKVNKSPLASVSTFFTAARVKQAMNAEAGEVIALMDSAINKLPNPVPAAAAPFLLERAKVKEGANDFRKALLDYDAYADALSNRVNDQFYYDREQVAMKSKQFQRALDDIKKAIELNPGEVLYRAELGAVNLRVGRYEEAQKALKEGIKIDPKFADNYRLLGICQIQLKKKEEAKANFLKAKELGDTTADALIEKHCK